MNLSKFKNQVKGPVRVYVPTGATNQDGSFVIDEKTGKPETILALEKVYYRPHVVTPELEKQIAEMASAKEGEQRPVAGGVELLTRMVQSWDCYEDDAAEEAGKPVPLTREGLAEVPASLIFACVEACTAHSRPPKTSAEKSPSSFSTEEQ